MPVPRHTHVSIPAAEYQAWVDAERANTAPQARTLLELARDMFRDAVGRANNRNRAIGSDLATLATMLEGADLRVLDELRATLARQVDLLTILRDGEREPVTREALDAALANLTALRDSLARAAAGLAELRAQTSLIHRVRGSLGDPEETAGMAATADQIETFLRR